MSAVRSVKTILCFILMSLYCSSFGTNADTKYEMHRIGEEYIHAVTMKL